MTTRYQSLKYAVPTIDDLNGEKNLQFSFKGLDYDFVFNPNTDAPEEGATLTCVSNVEKGRIAPKMAEAEAWVIANKRMNLPAAPTSITVSVGHNDDSLFGDSEIPSNYDDAVAALFASTSAALIAAFPGVDVDVKSGDFYVVTHDGSYHEDVEGAVGEIIDRVLAEWIHEFNFKFE